MNTLLGNNSGDKLIRCVGRDLISRLPGRGAARNQKQRVKSLGQRSCTPGRVSGQLRAALATTLELENGEYITTDASYEHRHTDTRF